MAKTIQLISRELFYASSLALAVFILMEIAFPHIVLAYFNLNYLILLWLAFGLASLLKE